jgi:hypothetical protein
MMKASMNFLPEEKMEVSSVSDPDSEKILPEDEADAVGALLRRFVHRDSDRYGPGSFAYRDMEEEDFVGKQALHRVVEDLQFGYAQRL